MRRYDEIDVARGIAILLVIVGHCITDNYNMINRFILSFHMPLFFIISGLVAKPRQDRSILKFCRDKLMKVIPAQITLGLIELAYVNMIGVATGGGIDLSFATIVYSIFRWWFLLVLLVSEVLFFCISNFISSHFRFSLVMVMDILVAIIVLKVKLPLYLHVVPFGLFFFLLGYLEKNRYLQHKPAQYDWLLVALGGTVCCVVANINTPVIMYNNQYGNILLFVMTGILGSAIVLLVAKHITLRYFVYLGKNSIVVYVLQFHSILILRKMMEIILMDTLCIESLLIYYLAVISAEILLMMVLTPFVIKFFPWAFGSKKKLA